MLYNVFLKSMMLMFEMCENGFENVMFQRFLEGQGESDGWGEELGSEGIGRMEEDEMIGS